MLWAASDTVELALRPSAVAALAVPAVTATSAVVQLVLPRVKLTHIFFHAMLEALFLSSDMPTGYA